MVGLIRLTVMLVVALTLVYVCLLFWARSGERQRLHRVWQAEQPEMTETAYVRAGMDRYDPVIKKRLLWGVYILPIGSIVGLIYILNSA